MRLTKIILLVALAFFLFQLLPAKQAVNAAPNGEADVEEPSERNAIPASPLVLPGLLKF
jgi:hypothetical protein